MNNVPEGWREVSLGKIALMERGRFSPRPRNDPKYYGGTVPFIQTGDVAKSEKYIYSFSQTLNSEGLKVSKLFEIRTIAITIAANIGEVGILGIPMAFPDSLVGIKPNPNYNTDWLFYNLQANKISLDGLATANAQKNINLQILNSFPILLPPLPEQDKIATILSTWDDSLSNLVQLIEAKRKQKRALAEQLLTGKRRLKGFEGEWLNLRFGDVFTRVTRKNVSGNQHALTISGAHGLIDQREFFNKRIAAMDLSGYYLLYKGEFAYNKSYSAGYDFGAIKRLNRYEAGVVSTLYICFALTRAGAVSNYFEHYFDANLMNEGISGIAQEGARNHGLLNVSVKDFFELDIPYPVREEQEAIAAILSTLDTEINKLEALQNATQRQKRGLMDLLLTGKVRVKIEEGAE
ncbi:restriction endonuclease subunit S [Deinococcus sp. SM5_A1]|uniref:restriction endonuclease subunit S n=1 Tax=Deinococcus sp. SM5_A1 TaxID=3379094 RepID=UPI00385A53DC